MNDSLVTGDDGVIRPAWAASNPLLQDYYDTEWGRPVRDERGLFERLSLEAFQSGLSWLTILKKRENFRTAFDNFDPQIVASYTDRDRTRLMADSGIVRNRRKIDATITNARAVLELRKSGGLAELIWSFQPDVMPTPHSIGEVPTTSPESSELARVLKKHGFVFVGPTTMFALMEAVGVVNTHLIGTTARPTT